MEIQHILFLWKGERFSYQTTDSLSQSIVQSFNMIRLPSFFTNFLMCLGGNAVVWPPQVAKTRASKILWRQFAPQAFATLHAPINNEKGEYLLGSAALDNPDTNLIDLHLNKGKKFICFQNIILRCWHYGCFECWDVAGFFLLYWIPYHDLRRKCVLLPVNYCDPNTNAPLLLLLLARVLFWVL